MFESENGDFDIKKKHINGLGEYVITAGLTNSGILGKTDVKAKIIKSNTFTVDMFGNAFYRQFKYKMVTHARVFSLKPKFNMCEKQGLFIVNSIKSLILGFGYENMCSWAKIKNRIIKLPTKKGKIDFDFMESFVAELEAQRVAELEAYLIATGLDDYELTAEEMEALENFDKVKWRKYEVGKLFDRVETKKLSYKAKELPKEPKGKYVIPALTSSFMNQGLNYYLPKDDATVIKNVISIPSNSDVYRAYYQSREFTVLSDSYAIEWENKSINFEPNNYIFSVACINKVTDLPIYSYKNKLGGWNVVKKKKINLPINSSNEIDYEYMKNLVEAIKKLVIKDVVLYADRKIEATRKVVNIKSYNEPLEDEFLKVAEETAPKWETE